MAIKNHNFRFNEEKEAERKAWQILHSEEVKEDFRSQNEFVIAAIKASCSQTRSLSGIEGEGGYICKRNCRGSRAKGT